MKAFDLGGQLIYHEKNITGPTHQFELIAAPGFYIVEIRSESLLQRIKLVKK